MYNISYVQHVANNYVLYTSNPLMKSSVYSLTVEMQVYGVKNL